MTNTAQLDVAIELGRQLDRHFDLVRALSRFNDFKPPGDPAALVYNALAIAGEAGEIADTVKKGLRVNDPFARREDLVLELGDVLYYWVRLVRQLDVPFEAVLLAYYRKLERFRAGGRDHTGTAAADPRLLQAWRDLALLHGMLTGGAGANATAELPSIGDALAFAAAEAATDAEPRFQRRNPPGSLVPSP